MLMRDTILVMDASPASRAALRKTFEHRFGILEAGALSQAEVLLRQSHSVIAAVLMDISLLGQHNKDSLSWLLENEDFDKIPRIALINEDDVQGENNALRFGFNDVIFRPINSLISEHRVRNWIDAYRIRWQLENKVQEQEVALRNANEAIVDSMVSLVEGRSPESGQHVMRIRKFTRILLEEIAISCPGYGLTTESIDAISSAAAFHDIGKISIPDTILNKPGSLTAEEYEIMKTHTIAGAEMLTGMTAIGSKEYMQYAYNICRYHHERWDGGGYPEGLKEDKIPICAQVVGLADCYDALTTDRVYKKAIPHMQAVKMIINGECGAFSPMLLVCFKNVHSEIGKIAAAYAEGISPKDDAIKAPLAQPVPTVVDTFKKLLSKYEAVLRFIDATVMDLDVDNGLHHVVYNPNPEFEFLTDVRDSRMDFARFAEKVIGLEGKRSTPETLQSYLYEFIASGQRQKTYITDVLHDDGSIHSYEITLLCPLAGARLLTMICMKRGDVASDTVLPSVWEYKLPIQYCRLDNNLTMPSISLELCNLLGYSNEELLQISGGRFMELLPVDRRKLIWEELFTQLRHSNRCTVEMPLISKSGTVLYVVAKGILHRDNDNNEIIMLLFADISESYRIREKLRHDKELQELLLAQSEDISFEMDFTKDRLTVSPKWKEHFGYTPISENMLERLAHESHFHPDDLPIFIEKIAELRKGTPYVEASLRISDIKGKYTWSVMRATLQRDEKNMPSRAVGVFIGIDDELRAAQRQSSDADCDQLTGLLNKQTCRRRIEEFLEEDKDRKLSALAIIDLDNFKELNDGFGHLFGDSVLTHIATEIDGMFRGTDIVGRIGGDEFLVFMPDVKSRQLVEDRFNNLISTVSTLLRDELGNGNLSCTVGISYYPDYGIAYEELFQTADKALYYAKKQGKGCCYSYKHDDAIEDIYEGITMISQRIDSEDRGEMKYNAMLEYAFRRLYASGDVNATINELLGMVGESLGVSRVYIFENNRENTICNNTFEWCNKGVEPQIDVLQNLSYEDDLPGFRESYNEDGVLYVPDITQMSQQLRDILEPQGIKSILHCAIRENGKFLGYVGLDDNDRIRLWTKEQIEVLSTLSHILSVFLLKERVYTHSKELVSNMHLLLNQLPGYLYVIDPTTYRLRFLNRNLSEKEPEAKTGDYCYKVLKGQNSPCKDCPRNVASNTTVLYNAKQDLLLQVTVGDIWWEGSPAWFINCQEIPRMQ